LKDAPIHNLITWFENTIRQLKGDRTEIARIAYTCYLCPLTIIRKISPFLMAYLGIGIAVASVTPILICQEG
jgi:hypothetical protein